MNMTEKFFTERNLLVGTCVFLIIAANVTVLFNVPILRSVFGFAFLTILPGVLLLQFFKIPELDLLERGLLCWGLSISFVMFYTLAVNFFLPALGDAAPLTTSTLLFSMDVAVAVLAVLFYRAGSTGAFQFPHIDLANPDVTLYIIPLFFPLLSVIGSYVMNTTNNNAILIALLFIIPLYVAFVCFRKGSYPKGFYPLSISLISLSLLLLLDLRSQHLVGADVHYEFYQFTAILNDHLLIFGPEQALSGLLQGVASISLPVAYQLILGVDPEAMFNVIYALLFAVVPLIVYVIARRYVGGRYAFLASFVYMAQSTFLFTNALSRTAIAILFFSLAFMTLFSSYKKTTSGYALFILFATSGIVSHYSTAYLFILIVGISVILLALLPRRKGFLTRMGVSILVFFGSVMLLWYSFITNSSVIAGGYVLLKRSFLSLIFDFFSENQPSGAVLGQGVVEKSILNQIQFILIWIIFACIALGMLTLIVKRKEMMTIYSGFAKPLFLKTRFDADFFALAVAACVILILVLFLPLFSSAYSLERTYFFVMTILSLIFVIGVITLPKWAAVFKAEIDARARNKTTSGREATDSPYAHARTPPYVPILVALMVIVPYFLCSSGALYAATGVPSNMIVSSTGNQYFAYYINDQESQAAKWIQLVGPVNATVATLDGFSAGALISQAHIPNTLIQVGVTPTSNRTYFTYLNSFNVVEKKYFHGSAPRDLEPAATLHKSKIFDAGSAQVYL